MPKYLYLVRPLKLTEPCRINQFEGSLNQIIALREAEGRFGKGGDLFREVVLTPEAMGTPMGAHAVCNRTLLGFDEEGAPKFDEDEPPHLPTL